MPSVEVGGFSGTFGAVSHDGSQDPHLTVIDPCSTFVK
jgi:hypothetical protein